MPIDIIIILISFIASILSLTVKGNKRFIYFFPVLLFVTLVVEYVAWRLIVAHRNNVVIYNFYSLFEFAFYLFFLNSIISEFYKGRMILYLIFIYFAIGLSNLFFIQGIDAFNTYTYMLGCLFVVTLCISYFNFLFRYTRSKGLVNLPEFWIVIGLLFSYAVSLPLFGITNFMITLPQHFQNILFRVINFMNIMLYLLFTIGFLCRIRINIRKSLQ